MTDAVTVAAIVLRKTDLVSTEVDRETILMSIDTGTYYGMADTARHIWEMMVSPCRVSEIVQELAHHYQADADRVRDDVLEYLNRLHVEGLIVVR